MNKIYLAKETDPYYNVATEYQLMREATNDTNLFLWQNSPAVIFGRNQSIFAEADTEFLKKNNISPVRRFSGGGAVFQDLGNLNFTFITKEKNANPQKYLLTLEKALSDLNIKCEFSGRNDLLCNGKKFSGHAYYTDDDNYLYHGTIMVDVNLDILSKVLKPSFLKLKSKGIDSVKSRVINLSQINKDITTENVSNSLIKAFKGLFGDVEKIIQIDKNNFFAQMYQKISTDKWIYQESPQFSITIEKKLNIGNVLVSSEVVDGIIKQIKIQTDSLTIFDFSQCEKNLIGNIYQENNIFDVVEQFIAVQLHNNL
ncbi:MAG: lipoate--protein ligase [Sphaerochaetaceae bacterium]|nr:lipoate--protein ligase [Sphaerochaetaceae bacterium]MDC7250408.1 lipoate--protein ligase [Sphaerochaetaceae bacterium]